MTYADVPATAPGPFQFSLLEILSWTTATAVFLASLECYAFYCHMTIPLPSLYELALIEWSVAVALAVMWRVLDRRGLPQGCLGAVVVAVALLALMAVNEGHGVMELAFFFSACVAWLIASLFVIRWAGYRLEWQRRFGRRQFHAPSG
jgi:hypothetical protein